MKTINKEISDALHMLFHCSLKDTEYTTQREQFREVYNYIEYLETENKKLKQPTIFIDTQDMEERYGEGLYMDYLKEENQKLKEQVDFQLIKIAFLSDRIEKAVEYIDYIKIDNVYDNVLKEILKEDNKEQNER